VQVDRLRPGDAERLRRIRLRALVDSPDAFGSTAADTAARPAHSWVQQLTELHTLVAVLDGADIGMVRGAPSGDDPHDAYLLSMWVDPDHRRRGVGEALVAALTAWARSAGFARLLLDVADHNAQAIALYTRCGFAPTGRAGSLPPPRDTITEHERALCIKPSPV